MMVMVTKMITIHPEDDMNVSTKYNGSFSLNHKCQTHGGARVKICESPKSAGHNKCTKSDGMD